MERTFKRNWVLLSLEVFKEKLQPYAQFTCEVNIFPLYSNNKNRQCEMKVVNIVPQMEENAHTWDLFVPVSFFPLSSHPSFFFQLIMYRLCDGQTQTCWESCTDISMMHLSQVPHKLFQVLWEIAKETKHLSWLWGIYGLIEEIKVTWLQEWANDLKKRWVRDT